MDLKNNNIFIIKLHIKAFNSKILNKITKQIKIKLQYLDFIEVKYCFLPKKIQRFTVLKSPHVHKKSREQFEIIIHKRLMVLKIKSKNKNDLLKIKFLIKYIKNLCSDAQIKLSFMPERNRTFNL